MKDDLSRRVRDLHIRSRKLVENLFAGNYHSVFKGPGLEFDEVRDYEYGDDIRFIDWNVSSRMNSPHTKTFREERELTLFMVVDISASLTLGNRKISKQETAGTIFALLALAAVANDDKVGSLLFADNIERLVAPRKGRRHVLRQISDVLGCRMHGRGSDLGLALRTAAQTLKSRSIIVVLSDFRMENYRSGLNLLAHKHDVIAIRLSDPLEREFPAIGLAEFRDPETGDTFSASGKSPVLKREYATYWQYHTETWRRDCKSAGIDMLEVDTDDDSAEKLKEFFQRRRKNNNL